jgi:hypothetical protein
MRDLRMEDIIGRLREAFPHVPEATIREIARRGSYKLGQKLAKGHDVEIDSRRKGVRFLVYKPSKLPPKPKSDE